MINATILALVQLEDYSGHRLSKYVPGRLYSDTAFLLNLYQPLYRIFSRVIAYDYVKRITEIGIKGINEEIIELVRRERPKYVLWPSTGYAFQQTTLDAIREAGSAIVSWTSDDEYRFDSYTKWWLPHLDYGVTYDIEAVPKYRDSGAYVIQVMPCAGIPVEVDWANVKEDYQVSFIGAISKRPQRVRYINEISNRNIPLSLFGRDWGRYVSFEEMLDIFGRSKINLNFSNVPNSNRMGLKGRVPLICLAGGFLLTEYAPGLDKYFVIDREIVCFETAEEMIDKINYYLAHDEERRAIARAGWEKARHEYTPFHMVQRVFNEIEADMAGGRGREPRPQKTPRWVSNNQSQEYFTWGKAFLEANHQGLWKDSLALSLSYNALNIGARYYQIIGFLPAFIRPPFFWLYRLCEPVGKAGSALRQRLLCWADAVPVLKNIKRYVAGRFYRG